MFKECEGCETNQQKPGNVQVKAVTLCPSLKLFWLIFPKQRGLRSACHPRIWISCCALVCACALLTLLDTVYCICECDVSALIYI